MSSTPHEHAPQQSWARATAAGVKRRLGRMRAGTEAAPATVGGEERSRDAVLLDTHPFFDDEWYRLVSGAKGDRTALVDHYLSTPLEKRVSPQPLFDPAWFVDHFAGDLTGKDPFLVFARRKKFRAPFHPVFHLRDYRRAHPEAAEHPLGPLGHYLDAAAGTATLASWWPADAGSARDFLVARTAEHRARTTAAAGASVTLREIERASTAPASATAHLGTVDVVLAPGAEEDLLRASLSALVAQTHTGWHVLVGHRTWGFDVTAVLADVLPAGTWTTVDVPDGHRPALDPLVVDAGTGEWITFLDTSDTWTPQRLTRLLAHAADQQLDVVSDVMEVTGPSGRVRRLRTGLAGGDPTLSVRLPRGRVLASRSAWTERARPALRTDLPSGHEFAMNRALAAPAGIGVVPHVGVLRDERVREASRRVPLPLRPRFDHGAVRGWDDVVLRDRLLGLAASRGVERDRDLVSVIIPTYLDAHMTLRAVTSVMEHRPDDVRVQVIVVNNGCRPDQAAVLDTMALRWNTAETRVQVIHNDANLGFALGNDVALPHVEGATTIFLNNDTVVTAGWLAPLQESLADDTVLGVQPLLLYPDNSVQCAGIAFPATGGLPYGFGQWHPIEDLTGLSGNPTVDRLRFHAVTAACLAMRTDDVIALGGFDPVYSNGMEDVDLCLRAGEQAVERGVSGPGFVIRSDSVVWHHESVSEGRFKRHATNRKVFLDRWHGRLPADDVALWDTLGFEVTGHVATPRQGKDRILAIPRPTLRRNSSSQAASSQAATPTESLQITESAPRLRWAIKNPAPGGPIGERWGDTHFADSLAEALRDLGQEVVIDRRQAWERRTTGLDDVALVLRGIGAYNPAPDQVNLSWVISHPDDVGGVEARLYDRVFGASLTWARQQSERWGFEVEPLLQATDPRRFHPDLALPDSGHPVLFVGSSRGQARPLVTHAVERNVLLSIYGTEWSGIVPPRFVKADYLDNRAVGAAYRSAGVVLNDHWEDMRQLGFVSNRLFDAAASGARVVSDDVAGLSDLFGRSVQVAHDADDLVRLTTLTEPDTVFGDDAERRAVAERVRTEHSFEARARRLVEVAVQAHRERGFDRFR